MITDLKQAFEEHSLKLTDIEYLIVNIGPGSFTGIRTALTLVKALEANLELKVITVNNFQILRYLNPNATKLAFRASLKNTNEYFVSLNERYDDLDSNFFATEIASDISLFELPDAKDFAGMILDYAFSKKDQLQALVAKEIMPYYLREPSLRLAKDLLRKQSLSENGSK